MKTKTIFGALVFSATIFLTSEVGSIYAASCDLVGGPCRGKNQDDDCITTKNTPGFCAVITDDETNQVTGCWCFPRRATNQDVYSTGGCCVVSAGNCLSTSGNTCGYGTFNPSACSTIATCSSSSNGGNQTMSGIEIPTNTGLPDAPVRNILENILIWMLQITGIIAIIAFVISGIQYLTAAGNEGQIETAKRNMLYSIIGVVVVLAAFVIIQAIDAALRASSLI